MTSATSAIKPPSADYDDDVLYGSRRAALKLRNIIKSSHNSECLIYAVGTYINKVSWSLSFIVETDKRVRGMLESLEIKHALPIQRYCWPQLQQSAFPVIFISPEMSGKTMAHLLFVVAACIKATPISKTDKILMASTDADPAQANFSLENDPQASKLKVDAPVIVDQDNFDFDTLGDETAKVEQSEQASTNEPILESEEFQNINPDDYIIHPQYIVICSSHQQVEKTDQEIERMKLAAFSLSFGFARLLSLPPTVSTIHVHQTDSKMAAKCSQCQILITTPAALLKCLKLNYIDFGKCKKVIFDDLDLTLQLHNAKVREIIKYYYVQTQDESGNPRETSKDQCQMYLFSRKWTDIVRQFSSTVFLQRTLVFGSLSEASLFANIRYEVEILEDDIARIRKLKNLINLFYRSGKSSDKMAVVFNTSNEAKTISKKLDAQGYNVTLLPEKDALTTYKTSAIDRKTTIAKPVYFLSDIALEFILNHMTDATHLVHFTVPEEILLFDQRFRLLYKYINEPSKNIMTSIFLRPEIDGRRAKELYDLVSRSTCTLNSTKLTLRDYVETYSKTLCWRWATTGVCRLEKLTRDDRLGSYCSERHSLMFEELDGRQRKRWPSSGQFKITITHILSPNEIYFWFEAHRDINSQDKNWTVLAQTGTEFMSKLQLELNTLKDTPPCSIPLASMRRGLICALYHPEELRVDRVLLLDVPDLKESRRYGNKRNGIIDYIQRLDLLEYSKQVEVIKIDYGIRITAYLRNLIPLPGDLMRIEAQAHRGFLIGVKPTDNEPNWLHKAKRHFYEQINVNNVHDVTAWMRLKRNNCFWFESLIVSRQISTSNSGRLHRIDPHLELCRAGLAERVSSAPSFLQPSERLRTLSKWNTIQTQKLVSFAFLRRDKTPLDIFILQIRSNLELVVRQVEFNQQLIELENELMADYQAGKLALFTFIEEDVYCLARVKESSDRYAINRCIIKRVESSNNQSSPDEIEALDEKVQVYCLDHGDPCKVEKTDLFQAPAYCITRLPFQALTCDLADLNRDVLENVALTNKIINLLYDISRDKNDQLIPLKCTLKGDREVYVYRRVRDGMYEPLIAAFENYYRISISNNANSGLRELVQFEDIVVSNPIEDAIFASIVGGILMDLIKREMSAFGLVCDE